MRNQLQADLFDLQKLSHANSGYKWILLVVDSFSRLVRCQPVKKKTGILVSLALDWIFAELKRDGLIADRIYLATDLG